MEPDKRLAKTKVYVKDKSEEIQRKAFRLGYKWVKLDGQTPLYMDSPFLYFNRSGYLLFGNNMEIFLKHSYEEVTADYILSLEPEPECPFKPFDKVLVRNDGEQEWWATLFSSYRDGDYWAIDGLRYSLCIPYEGNEHLAFTCDSPYGKKEETDDKQQK